VHALGHFLEQCLRKFSVRWVLGEVNGNEKFFGFGVYIANVNTALVGEEDPVALCQDLLAGRFSQWGRATVM
jgi:hypothetical protein